MPWVCWQNSLPLPTGEPSLPPSGSTPIPKDQPPPHGSDQAKTTDQADFAVYICTGHSVDLTWQGNLTQTWVQPHPKGSTPIPSPWPYPASLLSKANSSLFIPVALLGREGYDASFFGLLSSYSHHQHNQGEGRQRMQWSGSAHAGSYSLTV